jgi:hypothetical protein
MKVKNAVFYEHSSGKMLGFADVQFALYDGDEGLMTIKGWKVFRGDNGDVSVQPPATKKDGESGPQYFPTIFFSKDSVAEEFVKEIKVRVELAMNRKSDRPKKSASTQKEPLKKSQSYIKDEDEDDSDPF